MNYSWVLSAWQVLLTRIYHLSAITREYYVRAWQDLLTSIYHSSVITCEYKSTWQELLVSIFNSSAIAWEQCTSHVAWAQHVSYLQIFSRHEALLVFFCKLGCGLYCNLHQFKIYIAKDHFLIFSYAYRIKYWSYGCEKFLNQECVGQRPACAWFLIIASVHKCLYVYMCVRP